MPQTRKTSVASRLTAGCVTLVVLLATVAAGVGWWWKLRATARERALRAPAATAPAAAPTSTAPAPAAPSGGP